METIVEDLVDSLEPFLGQRPQATEHGVTFSMHNKQASVLVEIFPDSIPCGSAANIDGVHIVQTFCDLEGEPFNVKQLLSERYNKVIGYLQDSTFWGKLEFQVIADDLVILVHNRFERLTTANLEPDDSSGVSDLHCKVQIMLSEWEYLNNLLYVIRSGSKTMEKEAELFVRDYEGRA